MTTQIIIAVDSYFADDFYGTQHAFVVPDCEDPMALCRSVFPRRYLPPTHLGDYVGSGMPDVSIVAAALPSGAKEIDWREAMALLGDPEPSARDSNIRYYVGTTSADPVEAARQSVLNMQSVKGWKWLEYYIKAAQAPGTVLERFISYITWDTRLRPDSKAARIAGRKARQIFGNEIPQHLGTVDNINDEAMRFVVGLADIADPAAVKLFGEPNTVEYWRAVKAFISRGYDSRKYYDALKAV